MCSTDRSGLRLGHLRRAAQLGRYHTQGGEGRGSGMKPRDGEEAVGITCRQLPEEGVGWLGPRLESAQRRVSQDPRFLGTEDNELEMRRGGHRPSPQPITGRHKASPSVCDTLAITHPPTVTRGLLHARACPGAGETPGTWDGPCSAGQSLSPTVSYCQQFTVMSTGSHLVPLLVITDAQRLTHTTTLIGDAVCDSHT